jgi:hypothetical protein
MSAKGERNILLAVAAASALSGNPTRVNFRSNGDRESLRVTTSLGGGGGFRFPIRGEEPTYFTPVRQQRETLYRIDPHVSERNTQNMQLLNVALDRVVMAHGRDEKQAAIDHYLKVADQYGGPHARIASAGVGYQHPETGRITPLRTIETPASMVQKFVRDPESRAILLREMGAQTHGYRPMIVPSVVPSHTSPIDWYQPAPGVVQPAPAPAAGASARAPQAPVGGLSTPDEIKDLQTKLSGAVGADALGAPRIQNGGVDGIAGPLTRRAFADVARAAGINDPSKIDFTKPESPEVRAFNTTLDVMARERSLYEKLAATPGAKVEMIEPRLNGETNFVLSTGGSPEQAAAIAAKLNAIATANGFTRDEIVIGQGNGEPERTSSNPAGAEKNQIVIRVADAADAAKISAMFEEAKDVVNQEMEQQRGGNTPAADPAQSQVRGDVPNIFFAASAGSMSFAPPESTPVAPASPAIVQAAARATEQPVPEQNQQASLASLGEFSAPTFTAKGPPDRTASVST